MAAFVDNNTMCASIQFYVIFHVNSEKIYKPLPPPFQAGAKDIPFLYSVQIGSWGQPTLLFNGCKGGLSSGVKRPEREADDSPSSSVEFANECRYTSAPPVQPLRVEEPLCSYI
jgi:hypothetical protein